MSKLNCPCGWQLSNVQSPNTTEGGIITDIELDEIYENGHISPESLHELQRDVWECDKCGRLAISLPEKHDNKVKWYVPENGEVGHIMEETDVPE